MTTTAETSVRLLAPRVRGETRWFGATAEAPPGAVIAGFTAAPIGEVIDGVADESLDTVVALGALTAAPDPVGRLREWRRVLRAGGQLLLAGEQDGDARIAPQLVVALLNALGGFQVTQLEETEPGRFLLCAERSVVAGVRMPLGSIGPELAMLARDHVTARAELYFQFGAMLLQAQDPELAEACFRRSLDIDARSAESRFGLGMADCLQGRWGRALGSLQKAAALSPANGEVQRWLGLARARCEQAAVAVPEPN